MSLSEVFETCGPDLDISTTVGAGYLTVYDYKRLYEIGTKCQLVEIQIC
jgi:hypothetical protein